jgi:predicted DNA-binding ribbon-helix-helix protein
MSKLTDPLSTWHAGISERSLETVMNSTIGKRSVTVAGHSSSVSLEEEFWTALKEICQLRAVRMVDLIGQIDASRDHGNLSSAIRQFVLAHYQSLQPDHDACSNKIDRRLSTLEET